MENRREKLNYGFNIVCNHPASFYGYKIHLLKMDYTNK